MTYRFCGVHWLEAILNEDVSQISKQQSRKESTIKQTLRPKYLLNGSSTLTSRGQFGSPPPSPPPCARKNSKSLNNLLLLLLYGNKDIYNYYVFCMKSTNHFVYILPSQEIILNTALYSARDDHLVWYNNIEHMFALTTKWKMCSFLGLKWACPQIHANFHEILKMYLKVKYCEMNKERNLHIANGTYNPRKQST
jgi:hypothetical protein